MMTVPCSFTGSPPHTWGTRGLHNSAVLAHAVHPHIRGEHGRPSPSPGSRCGSPPHTWGTRCSAQRRRSRHRFTPTYVGNTLRQGRVGLVRTVHPHIRGEHYGVSFDSTSWCGSPPHTWGTRRYPHPPGALSRFTPTYVGNTALRPRPPGRETVHPHIRGEHAIHQATGASRIGSPPHTWGTRKGQDVRLCS